MNLRQLSTAFVSLPLFVALLSMPAAADPATVPAPTYLSGVYWASYSNPTISHVSHTAGGNSAGPSSATVNQAATPYVNASVSLGDDDYASTAYGKLIYSFAVNGTGTDIIPLHAYVKIATDSNVTPYDTQVSVGFTNATSSNGASGGGGYQFDNVIDFTAHAGDVTTVTLYASVSNWCCDDPHGSYATAYVDPYFYIDPDYLAAHPEMNLSLAFSSGVGNADPRVLATAVPEPSTWAMMIGGFGLLGAALRRRSVWSEAAEG